MRKMLSALCALLLLTTPVAAQIGIPTTPAGAGSGSVTSIATSCGVSGGTITTTGTISGNATPNAQTGTSYAILDGDCGKLVTLNNAASVAVSIAQAGTAGSFASGWFATIKNLGAGTVTLTPTTSTIDGAASITLATNESFDLYSNGSNYITGRGKGGGSGTVTTTGSPANGNLTQFSGATSITNGNLSGDCSTSGALATTCNAPHPGYIASNWYLSPSWLGPQSVGNAVGTANRIVCKYGFIPRTVTVGSLGARVTTAGTTNFQLAIYANSSGRPGALLSNTGNITSASTGVQTGALGANKQVGPGGADGGRDVWWCMNVNDTTTVFLCENSSAMSQDAFIGSATVADLLPSNSAAAQMSISCVGANCNGGSSTFNTWPATLAGSTWTTNNATTTGNIMPIVVFQAASVP